MDDMDSEMVLDTPDRLASSSRQLTPTRRQYTRRCREFGTRSSMRSDISMGDDTEIFFNQARLARMIPESSTKPHNLVQNRIPNERGLFVENDRDSRNARRTGKEIKSEESHGDPAVLVEDSSLPAKLVSKSGMVIALKPPINASKVERTSSLDASNTGSTFRDKGKGIDISGDMQPTEQAILSPLQGDTPQRNTRQRKLVRNGCISPNNITNNNTENRNNAGDRPLDGVSSHLVHTIRPDKEGGIDRKKKKVMVDDKFGGQHAKATHQSSRAFSTQGKEVTVIEDIDDDSIITLVKGSPEIDAIQHRSNRSSVRTSSESDSRNTREMVSKGKRKYSSTRAQTAECSCSSTDAEIPYLHSSNQHTNSKSINTRRSQRSNAILGPIVEVDDICSPEAVHSNSQGQPSGVSNGSDVRVSQVESDEILARQLQEQFYNEFPAIGGTEEIDANIAWSMQQEDQAQHSPNRDAMVTHRQRNIRNSSGPSGVRARSSSSNRMAQLRRNFNRSTVRLPTPHNFLVAREATLGTRNTASISHHILHVQRDFNEDDYEMLLALDENNQHAGATKNQINSLPQSVVETDNNQEACAVCLDPPAVGDTIRHLPCLHKFHKDCIDNWLTRRRLCPICKSSIT